MRIGILGGTFDPPHIGHLIIAEQVRTRLDLAEVWFIPTNNPPHKQNVVTDASQRVKMLALATRDNVNFKVNTVEQSRQGVSYTIDTITELGLAYPAHEFYFIIGADMVEYLPKWYKIDELLAKITFVGVNRPGYQLESIYPIKEVSVPFIDISSSLIRGYLDNSKSIDYLVPEAVSTYIKEQELYGHK